MNDLQTIYDLGAEKAYISCLAHEEGLIKESFLQAEHFYDSKHKNLFHAMKAIDGKGKPIDLIILMEFVGAKVDKVGGAAYVSDLFQVYPAVSNFKHYENIILEKWKVRTAVEKLSKAKYELENEQDSKVLTDLARELDEIEGNGYEDEFDLQDSLVELMDEIEQERNGLKGVDSGYTDLNHFTDGFQDEDLIICGARPSVGKTAFALNIAGNAATKDFTDVAIFSLEMGKQQLLKRMAGIRGNIDGVKLRDARKLFSSKDWSNFTKATGEIGNMNLHIFDKPGATMPYIRSKVRKLRKNNPNGKVLVIIDYLQLITGDPKLENNRTLQIGKISRELKLMAREFHVPVIALSQLSRGLESRQDKRPLMSDLRESGSIEQDADIIMFLHRDDYYDKETENKNIIEIIIAKQRNGPVGTVQLAFVKEYGKFVNLEKSS